MSQGLNLKNSWHDRSSRKMTLEVFFIKANSFDCMNFFAEIYCYDPVYQK